MNRPVRSEAVRVHKVIEFACNIGLNCAHSSTLCAERCAHNNVCVCVCVCIEG
jgi:hypothetical protein